MEYKNLLNRRTLYFIKNHRINKIEEFLGNGNKEYGAKLFKEILRKASRDGLTPFTVGKILGKDRHVLHQWYKRYGIRSAYYDGVKKSIILITLNSEKHNVQYSSYRQIGGAFYRVFYVTANELFAYFLGLILGDGSVDRRKVYISGGGSYDLLDKIYPKALKFGRYLGDRKVLVKYYDKKDTEVGRNHKDASVWRVYFYWSALSNFLANENLVNNALESIWRVPKLFNAFTAGFFDADGYFVLRNGVPERIGVSQAQDKHWFNSFTENLANKYSIRSNNRIRKYSIIKNSGKVYKGISKSTEVRFTMRSWPQFIDSVILPYCNKQIHIDRALMFKMHALNSKNRWR